MLTAGIICLFLIFVALICEWPFERKVVKPLPDRVTTPPDSKEIELPDGVTVAPDCKGNEQFIRKNPSFFTSWERKGWGNAFHLEGHYKCHGWLTPIPQPGDIIFQEMQSGKVAVYVFMCIKQCSDPKDMFFADLKPIGYWKPEVTFVKGIQKGGQQC